MSNCPSVVLRILPECLIYFVTGRRLCKQPSPAAQSQRKLMDQCRIMQICLLQLKQQAEMIKGLKKGMDEVKTQNGTMIKTLRDIHLVLASLSKQSDGQKAELYELRKRLTDFHEDTIGRYLGGSGGEQPYSNSSALSCDEMDSEASSIIDQPIQNRRSSNDRK